jgi:hypothetical protein
VAENCGRVGDGVQLAGGVELLQVVLLEVQQLEGFVVHGGLVDGQHGVADVTQLHRVLLRQINVVAEDDVLAGGREVGAEDFGTRARYSKDSRKLVKKGMVAPSSQTIMTWSVTISGGRFSSANCSANFSATSPRKP